MIQKICDPFAVLIASPELLKDVCPKAISDLKEMPCIVGSGKQVRSTWRMRGPSGTTEVTVRATFKANSSLAQLRACTAGIGIALLPSGLVREPLKRGELILVLPEYRLHAGGFYAVLPTRRHVPAAARHFMQFAMAKFENEDRFSLNDSEPARRPSGGDKRQVLFHGSREVKWSRHVDATLWSALISLQQVTLQWEYGDGDFFVACTP